MSKTRAKRKSEKRVSTAKVQSGWARQITGLNWFSVTFSAAFLLALPYLTGTNDLFWTSILLSAVLAMGLFATIWLLWKRQPLTLTIAGTFLLAFVFWQWLTVANSVYRWASMFEASRWTAFAILVLAISQLAGREARDEGRGAKQQLSHSAPRTPHSSWFAVSFVVAAAGGWHTTLAHFRSILATQLVRQLPSPRLLRRLRFSHSTACTSHLALRAHRTFVFGRDGFNGFKRSVVGLVRWRRFFRCRLSGELFCIPEMAKSDFACLARWSYCSNRNRFAPSANTLEV
jgi:hypothetical protein